MVKYCLLGARLLKEIYLTAFTVFFRAGGAAWSPGINVWKGIVGIALIEGGLLMGVGSWINVLTETKSGLPKGGIQIAFLILCAANYYTLIAHGHGLTFERNFNNLEKAKRIFLLVSCVTVMLVAIAFFIFSASVHRKMLN